MDVKLLLRAFWDRFAAWLLIGAGAVCLLLGWIGASGTPYVEAQIPYVISGGLTGLALVGLGATLWLSSDLRDEWYRLRDLEEAVCSLAEGDQVQHSKAEPTEKVATANGSHAGAAKPTRAGGSRVPRNRATSK